MSGSEKMSNFVIRKLDISEASLLKEFTYLAIYVPQGVKMLPKSIVEQPALKIYYQDFGTEKGDICLVAETDNKIVGAVWTRTKATSDIRGGTRQRAGFITPKLRFVLKGESLAEQTAVHRKCGKTKRGQGLPSPSVGLASGGGFSEYDLAII